MSIVLVDIDDQNLDDLSPVGVVSGAGMLIARRTVVVLTPVWPHRHTVVVSTPNAAAIWWSDLQPGQLCGGPAAQRVLAQLPGVHQIPVQEDPARARPRPRARSARTRAAPGVQTGPPQAADTASAGKPRDFRGVSGLCGARFRGGMHGARWWWW